MRAYLRRLIAWIKGALAQLRLFKFPNATIFGQPTIQDGQVSNFSATNYLQFPFLVDFAGRPWQIDCAFTTGADVSQQHNIFDSAFGLAFAFANGHFVMALSTNGTTWDLGAPEGTHRIIPNTTYYVRIAWDGSQYTLSFSIDKETYTTDIVVNSSVTLAPKQIVIGKSILNPSAIFNGSINMNHAMLTISGKVVWQGMDDAGLATRLAIDLSNIDAAGKLRLNNIAMEGEVGEKLEGLSSQLNSQKVVFEKIGQFEAAYIDISGIPANTPIKLAIKSSADVEGVQVSLHRAKSDASRTRDIDSSAVFKANVANEYDIERTADEVYLRVWKYSTTYRNFNYIMASQNINTLDAIKGQLSKDELLKKIPLGEIIHDSFVNSSTGAFSSLSGYCRTSYVPCFSLGMLRVVVGVKQRNIGISFYRKAEPAGFVSGVDFSGATIGDEVDVEIPSNAMYFAISALTENEQSMSVKMYYNNAITDMSSRLAQIPSIVESDNPCFWKNSSECRVFNKILCIGDSLTQGQCEYNEDGTNHEFTSAYSYPSALAAITGKMTTNKGDAGETTKTWWELHKDDADYSGHDACIIGLGRNDYVPSKATTSEERHTYMANIINKVRSENPQIKIFVATMLNYYKGAEADAVNADMRDIATQNGCYLLDISRYGQLVGGVDNKSHLTAVGYYKLAEYYFNYISSIVHANPNDFSNIQFIGTNHSYS